MDDVVGLELAQVGDVVELLLGNDLLDALEGRHNGGALLVVHVGEALVARDGGVRENADGDVPQLRRLADDVEVTRMNDVGRHGHVNALRHR